MATSKSAVGKKAAPESPAKRLTPKKMPAAHSVKATSLDTALRNVRRRGAELTTNIENLLARLA